MARTEARALGRLSRRAEPVAGWHVEAAVRLLARAARVGRVLEPSKLDEPGSIGGIIDFLADGGVPVQCLNRVAVRPAARAQSRSQRHNCGPGNELGLARAQPSAMTWSRNARLRSSSAASQEKHKKAAQATRAPEQLGRFRRSTKKAAQATRAHQTRGAKPGRPGRSA